MTAHAFARPITLDTLPDLFAHHRRLFGGWRMEDDGGEKKGGLDGEGFKPITTQADLDRFLSEQDKVINLRVEREREKYADYNDLKMKAEAHDKTLEAAKTEAEKAIDAARAEGEKAALERTNGTLVRAEARALAAEAKFRNPAVAVAAIDLSGVKVADDGTVDADAIKTALQALSDSDPYLVDDGKTGKPRPDPTQGGGGGTTDSPSVARGKEMWEQRHGHAPGEKKKAS